MKYAKLNENNIVIQIQPNEEQGFIEVDDDVYCGMQLVNGEFIIPEVIPTTQELQARLMMLCSNKTKEVAQIILGYKATDAQIATYQAKYEEALKYRDNNTITTYFDDTKEKYNEIIARGEAFINMKMGLIAKIEKFRTYVDDLILDGKLTEAKELIDNGIELL